MSLIYQPASYVERLDVASMFPAAQPLEVELGAGDGSFLVQWAKTNPQHNFLGVERLLGRIRKIERKANRAVLKNICMMRVEASYFLEYLLPRGCVTNLHIYFPDPWPKRKHRRNRLVNEKFVETCAQVLARGGTVFLRTDDPEYFQQMTQVFATNNAFAAMSTPAELASVVTDFEREFHQRGVLTRAGAYRLQ